MVGLSKASQVYQAAQKIIDAAKNMGQSSFVSLEAEQQSGIQGFSDLLKRQAKKVSDTVAASEQLVYGSLVNNDVDKVTMTTAVQEAAYQVEFASELLQRLIKVYEEVSRITL